MALAYGELHNQDEYLAAFGKENTRLLEIFRNGPGINPQPQIYIRTCVLCSIRAVVKRVEPFSNEVWIRLVDGFREHGHKRLVFLSVAVDHGFFCETRAAEG